MVLGTDGATCVSSQQLDPAVIEHVDTMIGDLQAGAEEGKNVKVPEAEQQQQQPEAGADDLQQAVEVLKEKQEQKNLYTGLVIGLVTGVGILCLLVSIVNTSLSLRPCSLHNPMHDDLFPRWEFGCGDGVAVILAARRVCESQAPSLQGASTPPLALTRFIYLSLR